MANRANAPVPCLHNDVFEIDPRCHILHENFPSI